MRVGGLAAVVDASVWVSLFIPHDAHHAASRLWLREHSAAGNPAIAPIILLAEIGGAIARRTGDSALGWQSVQQVQRVPGLRLVAINRKLGLLAATIAANGRLRGADTLYLAVAEQLNIPLISWDSEQLAHAARSGTSYTPQDLL